LRRFEFVSHSVKNCHLISQLALAALLNCIIDLIIVQNIHCEPEAREI